MFEKLFVWAMRFHLQLITSFHNESIRLMGNQVVEIEEYIKTCTDDERMKKLIADKEIYTNTFYEMQRRNTFLLMYSYLEEFLYFVWKFYGSETRLKNKGGINRFRTVFEKALGMDLGKDSDWLFICDCHKVRNCILHANARIDLSKDKVYLEKIVSDSNGLLKVHLKRIVLTDKFLQEANKVLDRFIAKVESKTTAYQYAAMKRT